MSAEPGYEGAAFVEGITTVSARLFMRDESVALEIGTSSWAGTLRERVGWNRRYEIETNRDRLLSPGDTVRITLPTSSVAEAVVTDVKPADPDDLYAGTLVSIAGLGVPPFPHGNQPEGPSPSGVREPRRPVPPAPMQSVVIDETSVPPAER